MVAGPAPPRWRPLYVQRQDSEQENAYENVGGAAWWWRCRRPGRAQTLEFHSRAEPRGRTAPRLRAVRVALDARLSASCAAIDVAPCVLLLPHCRGLPGLPGLPGPPALPGRPGPPGLPDLRDEPEPARAPDSTESDDD